MASSRKAIESTIKLSPREGRLAEALQGFGDWVNGESLCVKEFGGSKAKWPLNARHIVSGALNSLQRKLEFHRSKVMLAKRGNGGRAGIEYKLSTK